MSGMRDSRIGRTKVGKQEIHVSGDVPPSWLNRWRERAERAEAEVHDWREVAERREARVAELEAELRIANERGSGWREYDRQSIDRALAAEADRDAALDLLREVSSGRWATSRPPWFERVGAFLARVDSRTEPK